MIEPIFTGEISLIDHRAHFVRDMLFYTDDQLRRQFVMLELALPDGRRSMAENPSLGTRSYLVTSICVDDIRIFFKTILYALKRECINETDSDENTNVETHESLGEMVL